MEGAPVRLTADGYDHVEFYISTNPGEPLKPLSKVASGGELSRIILALKKHFFLSIKGLHLLFFDEVDTGVSGRVAQAIAEKNLSSISKLASTLYYALTSSSFNGRFTFIYSKTSSE